MAPSTKERTSPDSLGKPGPGEQVVATGRPAVAGEPRPAGREPPPVAMGTSHVPPAAEEQPPGEKTVWCEGVGQLREQPGSAPAKEDRVTADHKVKKSALVVKKKKEGVHDVKASATTTKKPKPSSQEKQGKAKPPGTRDEKGKSSIQAKTKPSIQGEPSRAGPRLQEDPTMATPTPPQEDRPKATPAPPPGDPGKAKLGAQDKDETSVQGSALKRELLKVEKAGMKAKSPVARSRFKVEEQSLQAESRGNSDREERDGFGEGEEEEEEPTRGTKLARTPCLPTQRRKREVPELQSDSDDDLSSSLPSNMQSPAFSPSEGGETDSHHAQRSWRKSIMLVWRTAAQHKYANLFLHRVKDEDAPSYHEVIHRPMDLTTLKKNIENGLIKTDTEFQRDILLMFQNAFMYNKSDHDVHKMAEEMRADVLETVQDYLATKYVMESSGTKALRSREAPGRPLEAGDDEKRASSTKRLFSEESTPSSPTKKKRKIDD